MVEGRSLHVDQIQISPEDLHEYINPSLLVEDYQPSDLKGDGCTNFFYEECNQPVTIYVTGEILIAIQDQKDENRVDSKHVESDCFPLSFSAIEWLKRRLKVSYQKQKFEIVDEGINFLEIDDKQEEQLYNPSQPIEKPTVCYE